MQLNVRLGLKVKEMHRVLNLNKKHTTKRQQFSNKIEDELYKLLNKCTYGKTCGSKGIASQSVSGCSYEKLEIIKQPCEKLVHSSSNNTKFLEKNWHHSLRIQQDFFLGSADNCGS